MFRDFILINSFSSLVVFHGDSNWIGKFPDSKHCLDIEVVVEIIQKYANKRAFLNKISKLNINIKKCKSNIKS